MTKVIKLLANISTEEEVALDALQSMPVTLEQFVTKLCEAVNKRNIEQNEEFILNAVSCITNILYYDTADDPLFTHEIRTKIFHTFKDFLLAA